MRGSINYQVHQIFDGLNRIGQSKHRAKEEARSAGARTWAEVGAKIGVFSYATADAYRDVWKHLFEHAKSEYGVKDIERIENQHVVSFLERKVDDGVARATFDQYAAACAKLEQALTLHAEQNKTGREYDYDLKDVRKVGANELGGRSKVSRAYAAPDRLVAAVIGDNHQLATLLQRSGGTRVKEISEIRENQLKGIWKDPHSATDRGWFEVVGKGGKKRLVGVSPDIYQRLFNGITGSEKRQFEISGDKYRYALKQAAAQTRQDYEGTHGLRWSWAQERHAQLQEMGLTYEQALSQVSREMGHERADITEHYLK